MTWVIPRGVSSPGVFHEETRPTKSDSTNNNRTHHQIISSIRFLLNYRLAPWESGYLLYPRPNFPRFTPQKPPPSIIHYQVSKSIRVLHHFPSWALAKMSSDEVSHLLIFLIRILIDSAFVMSIVDRGFFFRAMTLMSRTTMTRAQILKKCHYPSPRQNKR